MVSYSLPPTNYEVLDYGLTTSPPESRYQAGPALESMSLCIYLWSAVSLQYSRPPFQNPQQIWPPKTLWL
jgi:hypothetical protein